jgi:hypothetical protein
MDLLDEALQTRHGPCLLAAVWTPVAWESIWFRWAGEISLIRRPMA